ncbi:MAG: phage terminase large subunit [Pyrinomonadaceae bacterium]
METTEQEEQEQKRREGRDVKLAFDSAWFDEMVAAARVVYLWHNGKQHRQIEQKMHELGWKRFNRGLLHSTKRSDGSIRREAWPELFGWIDQVKRSRPKRNLRRAKPATVHFRDTFPRWLRTVFPEWNWGWKYQRYLYMQLARVTSGQCRRLMIFMPPRHGKSETVTIRYTAWRLLREPTLNVIIGSYNQRLANKFSRRIQRIHQDLASRTNNRSGKPEFPVIITNEASTRRTAAAAEWETGGGGTVRAVGVGAGIAGFGAGLVVIDDPVRNRADAESETYRDRVWDWFNDDVYTRLEPNASIILIQTRWHEDDLAGRLLREAEDGGEQWDVVRLPAIAEAMDSGQLTVDNADSFDVTDGGRAAIADAANGVAGGDARGPVGIVDPIGRRPGAALCPERYDEKALERTRKKLGSYSFAALYQQDPVPSKGVKFKREWFRQIVDEAPPNLRWKRGYDLAISLKTSADYTASFRCAYDKQENLYIADGFRKRIEYPEQRRYIIERMKAERNTEHGVEAALHGKALIQDLRRDGANRAYAFKEIKVATDKLTRALAWLNLAEAGKLFLVRGPWIDEFVDEICRFPHGKHDDQVDAVSIAVSMLAKKEYRSVGMLIT